LMALSGILVVSLLPEKIRQITVQKISTFESRTGFSAWMLVGLLFYWGLRLVHIV
jgi:hypothetical protein